MMNKLFALAALSATTASAKKISPTMERELEQIQRDGVDGKSSFARKLMNASRRVEQGDIEQKDISFISSYSLKFMGCHHVTQWANVEEQEETQDYADGNEALDVTFNAANGRIRTKGLVRYRLCPSDACFDHFASCSSNYGEYVVDMTNFLQIYIAWKMEEESYKCETYRNTCFNDCYGSSTANCYSNCYKKYGVNAALCSSGNDNSNAYSNDDAANAAAAGGYGQGFSLEDYLQCNEYNIYDGYYNNEEDEEAVAHYLGPYCADQGGDIKLGFFQDKYCTLPSTYQANYYEKKTGIEIPYTKTSLISTECFNCEDKNQYGEAQNNGQNYYNQDANGNANYYIANQVNQMCSSLYMTSGRCEVNFDADDVPYPEEGACTYIEGVKRLQDDGIIRSNQTTSSKPASIAIGIFTTMALLLGGYVYYLKSKIQKSRVNLAGATTSLA